MVIQQGDVILERMDPTTKKIGTSLEPTPRGFVLAEGEKTGHTHVLEARPGTTLHTIEGSDDLLLHLDEESQVVHEEHGTGVIPAGDYVVRQVQEYDHFAEEARKVQD